MTWAISEPDDTLTDQPSMKIYFRLQRQWRQAVVQVFESVDQYESDGSTMDSLVDMVDVLWERAQVAREEWEKFSRKYHEYIEAGPGPRNELCIRCMERPRRIKGYSDLCEECVMIVMESSIK